MIKYLKRLKGNSRWCTLFFPLWTVPYTIYMYYLSPFLLESGLTSSEIGRLMVFSNVVALIASLFSASITDKLGRKKTLLIFDIISSVLPPIVFLLSQSFAFSLVAMGLTGLNRIMSVGYNAIMVEDQDDENSTTAFNLFNLILIASGFLTPLAGLLVASKGLVKAEKLFLLVSAISMTILNIVRNALIKETETGKREKERSKGKSFFSLSELKNNFSYSFKNKKVLSAISANTLCYVYYAVGTTNCLFFTPFFAYHAGLGLSGASTVGGLFALGTIVSIVLINPFMTRKNLYKMSVVSSLVSVLGLVLITINKGISLYVGVIFIALAFGVIKTAGDSVIATDGNGEHLSGIYSVAFVISAIVTALISEALSRLYDSNPLSFIFFSLIVMILILILSIYRVIHERSEK